MNPQNGSGLTSTSSVKNCLSFVRLEQSHICSASGTPPSIIQHTESMGAGFPHTDVIRPLTRNLGALWQQFLPNYSLIYFIILQSRLCQTSETGMGSDADLAFQGPVALWGRQMCKQIITGRRGVPVWHAAPGALGGSRGHASFPWKQKRSFDNLSKLRSQVLPLLVNRISLEDENFAGFFLGVLQKSTHMTCLESTHGWGTNLVCRQS